MKVLLADDSRFVRITEKKYLINREPDMIIMEAGDGKETLDLFHKENPDVMIVDLLMPIMSGTEVMQQLCESKHNCFITILSSNSQEFVKERLYSLGAHLFVEKPVTPKKLDMILNEAMAYGKANP